MILIRQAILRVLQTSSNLPSATPGHSINLTQIRTKVIYHLPRPTEVKRVRKQAFITRVRTPTGRQYIMERILKGDKVVAQ